MAFSEQGPQPKESMDQFKARVEQLTGVLFDEIQKGTREDLESGHDIFARFGEIFLVGTGTPEVDPDTGEEIYSEFRIVDLSE